jgi:multiple sugar transport system permease protein
VGQVFTASLAAYAFARLRFFGRDAIFIAYLATLMIPAQVLIIPLFIIMRSFGWVDTYFALIVPLLGTPFGTFLLRQFYTTIPMELDEAAKIDGASELQIYARVIFRLSKPAVAVLTVLTFINTWNSFLWPLIVTNSTEMKTLPLAIAAFQNQYYTDWTLLMAGVILTTIPTLIIYVLAQKHLEKGVVLSGLKY